MKPILFSGPMVRALLEDRKTQTRRVLKPQPVLWRDLYIQPMHGVSPDGFKFGDPYLWRRVGPDYPDDERDDIRVPYAVGDLLWVRETWAPTWRVGRQFRWRIEEEGTRAVYPDTYNAEIIRWTPSIHMPRWASRLTLEVTNVCVERLQDISEDDAIAEGAPRLTMDDEGKFYESAKGSHRCGFAGLWSHMYGAESWDANPWVVVLSFTVHKCNVDDLLKSRTLEAAE